MSIQPDKINISDYRKLMEKRAELGAKVAEFIKSDGFLILKAVFKNFEREAKDTRQLTFEAYNSKMNALDIINGMFDTLSSYIEDGLQAQSEIEKLIDSEDSTPSSLSLDGEGEEEGQLSDF